AENRTGMTQGVNLKGQAFLEPLLQPGIVRTRRRAEDADRRATVDLFEPGQDWTQESFVGSRGPHVVDAVGDDHLHAILPHPLGRDEFGKIVRWVKGVRELVEVTQPIGCGWR